MNATPQSKLPSSPNRENREAAALRENLRKRKQQAQASATQTDTNKDTSSCP